MRLITEASLSRRSVVTGAVAAFAGSLRPSRAAAPFLRTQAPGWYRFSIGEFECTAISDGPLAVGPATAMLRGAPPEEINQLLADNFLPTDNVVLQQNALVVNTGRQLLLFDTGTGTSKLFGPTTGRLLANLKAAGIEASQIDAVILTHAHSDHCWGISEAGRPNFPNAQVHLTEADWDFWTDEAKLGPAGPLRDFVAGTRTQLLPVRERLSFVAEGKDVAPGVIALSAPGHTVGHTAYVITSGSQSLVFTGDLVHHHLLMMRRPRLEFAFDTDPKQAVESRLKVLDMLAARRLPILSYHFPFPGLGHVAKAGEGYEWHPLPFTTAL
jgi:glyoxylase-like metal-dependent hydrolase (beta-lactamase superfamily II)